MPDSKPLKLEAPTPKLGLLAFLAAATVAGVLVMISSVSNVGNVQANAAPVAAAAADQVPSPEENSAFIRQGHERAAREGDPSPLPSTF